MLRIIVIYSRYSIAMIKTHNVVSHKGKEEAASVTLTDLKLTHMSTYSTGTRDLKLKMP